MPFEKGHPKFGGRLAGVPNRATRTFKEQMASILNAPDVQDAHRREIVRNPSGGLSLFVYGHVYGKPKDAVEHSGEITLRWQDEE